MVRNYETYLVVVLKLSTKGFYLTQRAPLGRAKLFLMSCAQVTAFCDTCSLVGCSRIGLKLPINLHGLARRCTDVFGIIPTFKGLVGLYKLSSLRGDYGSVVASSEDWTGRQHVETHFRCSSNDAWQGQSALNFKRYSAM